MNKDGLIEVLRSEFGMGKSMAKDIVEKMVDSMTDALLQGEKVRLTGLGTFEVRQREGRSGTKPVTGEAIYIPPRKTVGFKPSKTLKDRLNR